MEFVTSTRRITVAAIAAGAMAVGAACTRTEPAKDTSPVTEAPTTTPARPGEPHADAQIATGVQAKYYADDTIRGSRIDVEAQNGAVTLRGTVPDEATKQRAVTLARSVEGVTRVDDELRVLTASTSPTGREPESGSGGEIGTTGRPELNQPWWITTKIMAQYFVNPEIKPWDIDVTTRSGGVVTLEGTVDSAQDKTEAVRIARATEGVTRVDDRLRVDPDAARERGTRTATDIAPPDAWLTAKIQAKYFIDADVKGREIDVDTRNGVVTLKGSIGSEAERRQAVALARNTDGVRDVKDDLRMDTTLRDRDADMRDRRQKTTVPEWPDAWITTKIQATYFLDPDVKGHQIDVDTNRGVVTLNGFVDSAEQKKEAEQIARETDGVRRVVNRLTVGARGA